MPIQYVNFIPAGEYGDLSFRAASPIRHFSRLTAIFTDQEEPIPRAATRLKPDYTEARGEPSKDTRNRESP